MIGDRFFFTHPNDGRNSERGLDSRDREYVKARKLSNILCDNIQDGLRYLKSNFVTQDVRTFTILIFVSLINENVMDLQSTRVNCSASTTETEGNKQKDMYNVGLKGSCFTKS
jgi:hypothetical protein